MPSGVYIRPPSRFKSKKEYKHFWYEQNKELVKERVKKFSKSPKGKLSAHRSYLKNKARISAYRKIWTLRNKAKLYQRHKERMGNDTQYRLASVLRLRLNNALRRTGKHKAGSAVKDLGCSLGELMLYLESKFTLGMTWENRGTWHIDHIKPLASFNLVNREELLQACHYTNLQPMWRHENLSKGIRINEQEFKVATN